MTIPLLTVIGLLVLLLGSGVWVGFSLLAVGIVSLEAFRTMPVPEYLGQISWTTLTGPELVALPLFIFMGELLFHTRLSELLFRGLSPWTAKLPGGLAHVTVLGATLFAAASGSSAATTAMVGRITLPELLRRGYDRDLVSGSLAGAGTFGLLIPPSIILIIYGILTKVSILQLFLAGIVPGVILGAAYMGVIALRATLNPSLAPPDDVHYGWRDRWRSLLSLVPMVFLIVLVIGSMYGGFAGPSEAATVGVFGACIIAVFHGAFTWQTVRRAALDSVRVSSMLGLILLGALFISKSMAFLGVPRLVAESIGKLGLAPFELIGLLILFYLVLGGILEGVSMIVMTLPITFPIVVAAGFDPIWFGIFLVLVVEMAQITPPIGINLFVIKGITGDSIGRIARASFPFLLIVIVLTLVMTLFPGLATFVSGPAGAIR